MKIANIKDLHRASVPAQDRNRPPTMLELQRAMLKTAKKFGYCVGDDGRCYVPYKVAAPLLMDGTHGRWEKGRVVPRKRA